MSCESPFELEVASVMIYESPLLYKFNGSCSVPALKIPSSDVCIWWDTVDAFKSCSWVPTTYKKVCPWGSKKGCWQGVNKLGWYDCSWVKGSKTCKQWLDTPAITIFPAITIPMTATMPMMISAGTEVVVSDVGETPLAIAEYAIYQNLTINGINEVFNLNFNFGNGISFNFHLPQNEVITITNTNGSFSATVPLYNFGTFPAYKSPTGFNYTLNMSCNLLFCLGNPVWLKLQVITTTTITGNGIPTQTVNITYAIPLVPE